ncbi:hypothetical protein [Methylocystis sp. B8]|uniref:hypothetical protein n=1 Tax=Methylocystis sp. B8 TaxID=544938 RepID=UPI0010FEA6F5|nr:hypothetical protein [Methylocystis sp. B8]TLG78605.1 hypothetical protein FEV16_00750 [Methylocystis sp. B8]
MDLLSIASNCATILTAVVATATAVYFFRLKRQRIRILETYLKFSVEKGQARRLPHLMAECLMTEGQLFEAALASRKVNVWNAFDDDGNETPIILFNYDPKGRARKVRSK